MRRGAALATLGVAAYLAMLVVLLPASFVAARLTLPPGVTLISRHVAVRQLRDGKTTAACKPANLGQNWSATPALPGDGFQLGDALAIGTDTHYRSTDSAEAFVTVTWSEIVAIESGS